MESWLLNLKKEMVNKNRLDKKNIKIKRIIKLEIDNQKIKLVGLGTINQKCAVVSNKCY